MPRFNKLFNVEVIQNRGVKKKKVIQNRIERYWINQKSSLKFN